MVQKTFQTICFESAVFAFGIWFVALFLLFVLTKI